MGDTATVLLVDTTGTVADRLHEELGESPPIELLVESDLERAQTRIPDDAVDCLVLNLDPLDERERRAFLDESRELAPRCPVVLFTGDSAETVSDGLLTEQTTVVERADDADNWAFLVEKIRRSTQTDASDSHDEMYRTLVESARDGLYRLDANGDLVYANESWAQMLGYERDEIRGVHASEVMADGELERGQQLIQQLLADDDRESDIIDLELVTKDGTRITVAIHFVVLTTDEGLYDGVMGVARDVTDRRANERELEQKNERLDEFASVVSHDLRNPLNVAQMRLEILSEESAREHDEHIEAIDRSLTRMENLVEDLLTLAREGDQLRETEPVHLGDLTEQSWQTIETADATLDARIDRQILADRSRLKQLLENLMQNSVEHGGPAVTVTVGELDAGFFVEDDGPGIPASDRDRVFDAGFSTADEGTGFGLNIAKQVVDAHDWDIRVTDSPDGGVRFEITGVTFVA